jgi:serine/threonine protein kinase
MATVLAGGVGAHHTFVVYEVLPGTLLSDEISKGPIAITRALSITTQILKALNELHGEGTVHGHLTAHAVLLVGGGRRDTVKVLDTGLSYVHSGRSTQDAAPSDVQQDLHACGHLLTEMIRVPPESQPVPLRELLDAFTSENMGARPVSALHAIKLLQAVLPAPVDVSNLDILTLEKEEFALVEAERRDRSRRIAAEVSDRLRAAPEAHQVRRAALVAGLVISCGIIWFLASQLLPW